MSTRAGARGRCLDHEAFVYAGDDEYVATLAPLLARAAGAGDPVTAVLPERGATLLRAALGTIADQVSWVEATEWYRHPVRAIAAYERALRQLGPEVWSLVIGEIEFGTTERERADWTRYESAINRALAGHRARVICPYDARSLPADVVVGARWTHPHLLDRSSSHPSPLYTPPETLLRRLAGEIVVPRGTPDVVLEVGRSLREGRDTFVAVATAWGLSRQRARELSVGVSEVLTNALVHGGGHARLRVWGGADTLACLVEDRGSGSSDPLLGYLPPRPGASGGYGLWLTRQLFDRTELARAPGGGMQVLLTVDR